MEKTKVLIIAVIALFLLNAGMLVFLFISKPLPPPLPHHEAGMPLPPAPGLHGPDRLIIESLKLDSNQQKQFEVLKKDHHEKMMKLDEVSKDLHHRFYDLIKDDASAANADSLASAIGQNRKEIELLNFDHFQKLKGLCTTDQKKAFDGLIGEILGFFAGAGPRHEMRSPPRDGMPPPEPR